MDDRGRRLGATADTRSLGQKLYDDGYNALVGIGQGIQDQWDFIFNAQQQENNLVSSGAASAGNAVVNTAKQAGAAIGNAASEAMQGVETAGGAVVSTAKSAFMWILIAGVGALVLMHELDKK